MTPKLIFIGIVWLIYNGLLLRALYKNRISLSNKRLWLQCFLCCVTLSFWGQDMENLVDQWFAGLPIGLYIKYISVLGASHLFIRMVEDIEQKTYPWFIRQSAIIGLMIGLPTFVIYWVFPAVSKTELRFYVIGLREFFLAIATVGCFVPGALAILQYEKIGAMRIKLKASLICNFSFMVTAVASFMAVGLVWSGNIAQATQTVAQIQPFVVLNVIAFLVMVIPHRWLTITTQLPRLYILYRLRNLQRAVYRLTGRQNPRALDWRVIYQSPLLELTIYRTIIQILDTYHTRKEVPLCQEVRACVRQTAKYPQLIQQLARIRP